MVDSTNVVDLTLKRARLSAMDRDGGIFWHPIFGGEVQPPPGTGSWWFEDRGTKGARERDFDGQIHDQHPWVPAMEKERLPAPA